MTHSESGEDRVQRDASEQPASDVRVPQEIAELRARIDRLDAALLYLLAERFACTEAIGRLKRDHDLPALDTARENSQRERLAGLAEDAGVDPDVIEEVFSAVTSVVRRRHDEIRKRRV